VGVLDCTHRGQWRRQDLVRRDGDKTIDENYLSHITQHEMIQ